MPHPVAIGGMNCENTFCPAAPSLNEKCASAKAFVLFRESILVKENSTTECIVLSVVSEYTLTSLILVNGDENSLFIVSWLKIPIFPRVFILDVSGVFIQ